jgi:4-amino-4-deoxy-L-arabinose transferase-like glycosyltransferase
MERVVPGLLAVGALLASVRLTLRGGGLGSQVSTWVALGAVGLTLWALWFARDGLRDRLARVGDRLAAPSPRRWLVIVLGLGLLTRLVWLAWAPIHQTSDYAMYLEIARHVAEGEGFFSAGPPRTQSYWPPGYPLLLAPVVRALGPADWAPIPLNLALHGLAIWATLRLGRRTVGEPAARAASLFLAVWPNLVTYTGLAAKENLTVALLPLVLEGALTHKGVARRLLSGGLLGLLVLTQGSWLLLPVLLLAFEWVRRRHLGRALWATAPLALGLGLVLAPWAARNHRVHGDWVLLTTNGGVNLYLGTIAEAGGGYSDHDPALPGATELARDRAGWARATAWIAEQPFTYASLALGKAARFLGDDSSGLYDALRRSRMPADGRYAALKVAAHAVWWGLWVLILLGCRAPPRASGLLLLGPTLYLLAVHTAFFGAGRFHLPVGALLALMAGRALGRATRSSAATTARWSETDAGSTA